MEPKVFDLGEGYHLACFKASNRLAGFHSIRIELRRGNGLLVKEITDGEGNFLHFPEASGEEWLRELSGGFRACARFNCYAAASSTASRAFPGSSSRRGSIGWMKMASE